MLDSAFRSVDFDAPDCPGGRRPVSSAIAAPLASAQPADPPAASGELQWCGRSRTASGCSAARPISSATSPPIRADGSLAAEQQLGRATPTAAAGRETCSTTSASIPPAQLLDTCERDGERENYLAPERSSRRRAARRRGAAGRHLHLEFDDGTMPAAAGHTRPATRRCGCACAYGKPTIATVDITRPDSTADSVSTEIEVARLSDRGTGRLGRRRRRQSGPAGRARRRGLLLPPLPRLGARANISGPSRAGYKGDKACDDSTAGSHHRGRAEWKQPRRALDVRGLPPLALRLPDAHRARARGREPARIAVTFLPLACTGATIEAGLFGPQARQRMPGHRTLRRHGAGADRPSCSELLDDGAQAARRPHARSRAAHRRRQRHQVLRPRRRRHHQLRRRAHAVQPGRPCSPPCREAQRILDRDFPADFAKLRAALKPLVGGNLSRVVFVSYGHPALERGAACPGGRDGLRRASGVQRRRRAAAQRDRLRLGRNSCRRLKALARCEAGTAVREPRHRPHDLRRSPIRRHSPVTASARAPNDDPEFDRECFSPTGKSFERRSGGGRDRAAGLRAAAARVPPLCAARALDPHRQRQLLHRDDLSARAAVDAAAEQHPRRDLGRDVARSMAARSIRPPRATPRWPTRRCRRRATRSA